jgi:hypothetical protein
MTKKDFEFIAGVIARLESIQEACYGNDADAAGRTEIPAFCSASFVAQLFEESLSETHPRFKPAVFEAACLPRKHERLKAKVLASLGNPDDK